MRLTSILKFPKNIKELANFQSLNKKKLTYTDYIIWLQKDKDLTFKGIRKNLENTHLEAINEINKFQANDFAKLGAELHAASYVLKIGGKSRIHGSSKWLELGKHKLKDLLPEEKTNDLYVEGLNFTKTIIQLEGLSNMEECLKLNTLIFDDCYFFDDWCLRKLAHTFTHTLFNLDISNCQRVTDDGLMSLGYLKNLKRLSLSNLVNVKNKEYISVLLEENNPDLVIHGLDHLSEQTLKNVEKNLNNELLEFNKIKQNLNYKSNQNNEKNSSNDN